MAGNDVYLRPEFVPPDGAVDDRLYPEGPDAGSVPGNATGPIGTVTLSTVAGAATGRGAATGAVPTVTVTTAAGIATGKAATSGTIPTITVTTAAGSAVGRASCSGSIPTVTLSTVAGAATGRGACSGSIGTIALSTCAGAATGKASAAGGVGTVTLSPVEGSATGGVVPVPGNASGEIGTITVTGVFGSASGRVDRTPVLFTQGVAFGGTGPTKRRRKRIEIVEIEDEIIIETPPPIVESVAPKKKRKTRKVAALSPLVLECITTPVPAFASGDLPTYRVTPIEGNATGCATAVAEVGSFVMLAHDRRAPWRTEHREGARNSAREYAASLRNRRAA